MLSISGYRGVEEKVYESASLVRDDSQLETYRVVRPGQLAVNTMWLNYAGLGISDLLGHMSPAYRTYWMSSDLDSRFAHHLLRSSAYVQGYTALLTGIRPNSLQMSRADLMAFPVLMPPISEQRAIADYLDRETAQIDAFIAKNAELIAFLAERTGSVISRAVKLGLDASAPMKDSGHDWIGPVPMHWDVLKVRHVLSEPITDGPHTTPDFIDEGIPFLSVDGIVNGELTFEGCRFVSEDEHRAFSRKSAPRRGDILMGKAASVGKIARVRTDREFSIWSPLALLRPSRAIDPEFLELCLKSASSQGQFAVFANYNTQANISMGDIGEVLIAMPRIEEQREIARKATAEVNKIGRATEVALRSIQLARERRAALISAAVTGKIDVGVAV